MTPEASAFWQTSTHDAPFGVGLPSGQSCAVYQAQAAGQPTLGAASRDSGVGLSHGEGGSGCGAGFGNGPTVQAEASRETASNMDLIIGSIPPKGL